MGTAMKHPVPDRVKPLICNFWHSGTWASECPDVKTCNWRLNAVWHSMLYSCTNHTATVQGVRGLIYKTIGQDMKFETDAVLVSFS